MLHYWTAGESHGRALVAIVDGFPAGVHIRSERIDAELRRRQGGYGRGGRQRIETDCVEILTGIWQGTSIGSPIALQVANKDCKLERMPDLDRPRPGHGDLTGAISIWVRFEASWSEPALAKPRCVWPPERWLSNCWPNSSSVGLAMWSSWAA